MIVSVVDGVYWLSCILFASISDISKYALILVILMDVIITLSMCKIAKRKVPPHSGRRDALTNSQLRERSRSQPTYAQHMRISSEHLN
jgi:hypothetical protein